MKELLFKEFKLAMHPTSYLFLAVGALLLIPAYIYYVAFIYTCLSIFFLFLIARENKDILFTVSLPVRKRDAVKARCLMVAIIELAQTLLAVPCHHWHSHQPQSRREYCRDRSQYGLLRPGLDHVRPLQLHFFNAIL